jgi:hypothetical protein
MGFLGCKSTEFGLLRVVSWASRMSLGWELGLFGVVILVFRVCQGLAKGPALAF